ncbi:FAD-dependent monooxygenase [Chelatococcus asaccharovorans]|uniref:Salicylate hydroxylase n=1 Tax=Chelatococcus asaccharovorans TaxID=28210 RepID=A0A2V3UE44_9HYPH|nr:FAD-dependent monooxygenase [Chelatococcus asaccharovorans]MBS7703445.1 FAD-dependent monooxygenase [Chelatococcus asaccharovorans]PXW61786.1 salicylate hydroxylase [Chelatococcus asaccharovorans]
MKAIIIGGGIGGIISALTLTHQGIDVELYERADGNPEIGSAVQFTANVTNIFQRIGSLDVVKACGSPVEVRHMREWNTGTIISTNRLGDTIAERELGSPYLVFQRSELLDRLGELLPAGVARYGMRCVNVEQDQDGVRAVFENGHVAQGDVLIGADGIRSTVRRLVFGEVEPVFSGKVAYRGLIPQDELPDFDSYKWTANAWPAPGQFLLQNFAGRACINLSLYRSGQRLEDLDTGHRTAVVSTEEVVAFVKDWEPSAVAWLSKSREFLRWPLFDIEPLKTWTEGRVALLGDAAHATLPFIGQGAGQGAEDASALADALALTPSDPVGALKLYEEFRLPRASRVQLESRARSNYMMLRDPFAINQRNLQWREASKAITGYFGNSVDHWILNYDVSKAFRDHVALKSGNTAA